MSVSSEITRLYGVRSDIFDAITAKGVTVPSDSQLDDCPTLIGQISGGTPTPPIPSSLPAYTLRLKFTSGVTPTSLTKGTFVQVQDYPDYWDWTYESSDWSNALGSKTNLLEVVAAGDTSGVTNMNQLFQNDYALSSVALFDTSNVTSMASMFNACYNLSSVALFDTSNVTNMGFMFYMCHNLTSIPLFNTSNVQSMTSTFSNCLSLQSLPLLNTSHVTNMWETFKSCISLRTLPLFDTSSVTTMNNMCSGCRALTSIPLLDTSSVTNVVSTFNGCYKVESGALALYQQMSTQATPPNSHNSTFLDCGRDTVSGTAELAQIPTSWGGTMSA